MASLAPSAPLDKPLYGATFAQAVKRFLAKYATFSGRASRSEYWWSVLFVVAAMIVIWVPGTVIGLATGTPGVNPSTGRSTVDPGPGFIPFAILGTLFYLAIIVPSIAITIRRLHDAGFSGLLYLLVLIPSVGGLALLVFTLLESKPDGARFDAPVAPPVAGS
ncbi:MAG: DUF805 domain-containing protein [Pseudolysinimonas sp.]